MPKNVGFRVTGLYFGAKSAITGDIRVDVTKNNATVFDVMQAVVAKVRNAEVPGVSSFGFSPNSGGSLDSLHIVSVQYTTPPKMGYTEGIYTLQESTMGSAIQVFQYYHYDEHFNQKNTDNDFINFTNPPKNPIVDNDTIVWRLVTVLQGPNGGRRVQTDMVKMMQSVLTDTPVG